MLPAPTIDPCPIDSNIVSKHVSCFTPALAFLSSLSVPPTGTAPTSAPLPSRPPHGDGSVRLSRSPPGSQSHSETNQERRRVASAISIATTQPRVNRTDTGRSRPHPWSGVITFTAVSVQEPRYQPVACPPTPRPLTSAVVACPGRSEYCPSEKTSQTHSALPHGPCIATGRRTH